MAIKDLFKARDITQEEYTPQIVTQAFGVANIDAAAPNFKGEVKKNDVKFPAELGEEHPFDFSVTEGLYKKFGFATGVIDKYVDYIVGPGFWVDSEDERATTIIQQFMQDVNFDTVLRAWIKEGLVKNGFLELGGKEDESVKGVKVLDSKWMYVQRDKKGVIEGYNQFRGGFNQFAKDKVIPFKPFQIAHIAFNRIGDMPYGMGIIYPAVNTINNLLQNETDLHMLMNRKANAPYHVKLGGVVGGKYFKPNPATVTKFGRDLEWLNNKHEWVTDGLTDIKAIDFGNIGEKFNEVLKYDTEMLLYTFQVPSVLMGTANINEGIAKVQMDGFERRVKSFQAEIEKVVEEKIFKRILQANGLDVHVEFHWGRPSNTERYERLMKMTPLMVSQTTSHSLSRLLEKEAVKLFELDEAEFELLLEDEDKQKEEERKREEERPQPIVPGQNANKPQRPKESLVEEKIRGVTTVVDEHAHNFELDRLGNGITNDTFPLEHTGHVHEIRENIIKKMNNHKHRILSAGEEEFVNEHVCPHCADIKEGDFNDIEEWLGFNYKEYLANIEKVISADEFTLIKASSSLEATAGRLTEGQVVEFKKILSKGFKKGSSIKVMVDEVNKKVGLKDLLKMENGVIVRKAGIPVLVRRAENRGVAIVRSEVTRVANEGALAHFKEGGISKVRWVASFGARTCPQCEALDGIIFDIDSHPDMPLHTMCRCTFISVTELG